MSGPAPSEIALIELWDYIDAARLKQSEAHAAIIARRALNAATGVDMEELDIGGMDKLKVLELIKLIGLPATKDLINKARQSEKEAADMGIAFKAGGQPDMAAIVAQIQDLAAQLDDLLSQLDGVQVETKRVDYAAQHTPTPRNLPAQKAYDVNRDPMALVTGADQLGRKR